jgi:hypothetical protein
VAVPTGTGSEMTRVNFECRMRDPARERRLAHSHLTTKGSSLFRNLHPAVLDFRFVGMIATADGPLQSSRTRRVVFESTPRLLYRHNNQTKKLTKIKNWKS